MSRVRARSVTFRLPLEDGIHRRAESSLDAQLLDETAQVRIRFQGSCKGSGWALEQKTTTWYSRGVDTLSQDLDTRRS
jgi:hypothetical protein